MANSIVTTQNIQKNCNIALPLSGIHSIISKDNRMFLRDNKIVGSIIFENSKCIVDSLNTVTSKKYKKIYATDNSFITQIDQSDSLTKINTANNSLFNFSDQQNNQLSSTIKNIINYVYINNDKNNKFSNILWNNYLINDGNKFYWNSTENLNNKIACININTLTLKYSTIGATNTCQDILNIIPKNLRNIKLQIIIDKDVRGNIKDSLQIKDFYNGIVELQINQNNKFKNISCENIQNLEITNCNLSGNLLGKFNIDNVKNCQIYNNTFENIEYSIQLNSFNDKNLSKNYKAYFVKKLQDNSIKSIFKVKNSKCIIRDNNISNITFNMIYGTLNSEIYSYNNIITIYQYADDTYAKYNIKRPILYYLSKNSTCTAYDISIKKDSITFTDNNIFNDLSKQIQQIVIEQNVEMYLSNRYTFIYGYACPGSIFNHQHKKYILKKNDIKNKNNNTIQLPLGSMYYVPSTIINKTTIHNSENIGLISIDLNKSKVGLTYPNGYLNIVQNLSGRIDNLYTKYDKQIDKLINMDSFNQMPIPTVTQSNRIKSSFSQNAKYAKIYNNIFELNSNHYFITDGFTTNYLSTIISVQTGLPNKNINASGITNQYQYVIQYSQRIKINNNKYITNLQE